MNFFKLSFVILLLSTQSSFGQNEKIDTGDITTPKDTLTTLNPQKSSTEPVVAEVLAVPAAEAIAAKKAADKAKKESEKALKKELKEKKDLEKTKKEFEKKQNKLEKQQEKIQKEQKNKLTDKKKSRRLRIMLTKQMKK